MRRQDTFAVAHFPPKVCRGGRAGFWLTGAGGARAGPAAGWSLWCDGVLHGVTLAGQLIWVAFATAGAHRVEARTAAGDTLLAVQTFVVLETIEQELTAVVASTT